jgi:hypothetical protein
MDTDETQMDDCVFEKSSVQQRTHSDFGAGFSARLWSKLMNHTLSRTTLQTGTPKSVFHLCSSVAKFLPAAMNERAMKGGIV